MTDIRRYINSIRNKSKRKYADMYCNYKSMVRSEEGDIPDTPQDLSYMAAQAVRMRLDEMFKELRERTHAKCEAF